MAELGFRTYPQPEAGDDVLIDGPDVRRVADVAAGFDEAELTSYIELVVALDAIAAQVPLDAPWTAAHAAAWDAVSLGEWVRSRDVSARVAGLFEVGVQAVFAASEPAAVAAPRRALRALRRRLVEADRQRGRRAAGPGRGRHATGGGATGALLPEGCVRLGHAVTAIRHGDRVRVEATGPDGGVSLDASRVVVALPPTLAGRIAYDPPLDAVRDQLVQHMPQGSVIKFHVLYDEPWWRAEGLSGMVLAPQEPIGVTFDCTPPGGTPGLVSGFFEGPSAVAAGQQTMEERRAVVTDVLARAWGERARDVLGYVDRDWSAEPFTRGCYGAHLPPGAWTVYGPALRRPIGPIHWAGTETAERWTGYIDGAIDSGQRVAAEVLAALAG